MRSLLLALLLASGIAQAQPMMIDPSQMSGIPRPDPQVPANTITVRLIRGELSNRLPNVDVELTGADGKKVTSKTDAQGRATFADLTSAGPYIARAKIGEVELQSQPIQVPPQLGVRVMLVFPKGDQAGHAVDGAAHADPALPANTLIVSAADGDGAPLPGLEVVLAQARAGEDNVHTFNGKTNEKGEAIFAGVDAKVNSGYLAEIVKDGTHYASKPFKMVDNVGMRVGIEVRPVSKDVRLLRFANGSYIEMHIADDAVVIFEMLRLENQGTLPIDPGVLHIPLPDAAVSAQVAPRAGFAIAGHDATIVGPIASGITEYQLQFVLAYRGGSLELLQKTPVPFEDLVVVTDEVDGVSVEGDGGLTSEPRANQNGKRFRLYRGRGTQPGGEVRVTFNGLPHSDPTWRLIAAGLSVLIVLSFFAYAFGGGKQAASHRQRLLDEREQLLNELLALEKRSEGGDKAQKRREDLRGKLLQVYRKLDEVNA